MPRSTVWPTPPTMRENRHDLPTPPCGRGKLPSPRDNSADIAIRRPILPYLDHAGARLFYTVDGPESAPAILFSNSLGTDHTMWQPQAEALAGRYRVVRYDTRGHGRSTAPGDAFTMAQLGGDALAILDALSID